MLSRSQYSVYEFWIKGRIGFLRWFLRLLSLLRKVAQSGQPLSNIEEESRREGFTTLYIILHEPDGTIWCDRYTSIKFDLFLLSVNDNTAEVSIMPNVQINSRKDRNKKTNISIQ